MKYTIGKVGAALLVALILCLTMSAYALDTPNSHQIVATANQAPVHGPTMKWIIGAGFALIGFAGTVVLTYLSPNLSPGGPTIALGGTVPPTANQAANINTLGVLASTADSDTSIAIVHNWGLSTADLAAGYPIIDARLDTAGTAAPVLTNFYTGSAANTLTVTKASAAGSGGTIVFKLQRPSTLIR